MAEVLKMRFLVRTRTAAEWTAVNEVLLKSTSGTGARELGIEEDTGRFKLGDGVTAWNSLPYLNGGAGGDAFAVASGIDTITATFTVAPDLVDGLQFKVRAAGANTTTAPTFNPNSLGALTLYKLGGQALAVGDISGAGHALIIRYRTSPARYELLNPAGVQELAAGTGVAIDNSDPRKPIISSTLGSIGLSGNPATYGALPSGLGSGDAGKAFLVQADGLVYIWSGSAFPTVGKGVAITGVLRVVKKTDESRASTTTLANDAELSIYLGPGTYHVRLQLATTQASGTPRFQAGWSFTGVASGARRLQLETNAGAYFSSNSAWSGAAAQPGSWASGQGYWQEDLFLVVTTGGTLSPAWAQQVSNASPVVVKAGSVLEVLS